MDARDKLIEASRGRDGRIDKRMLHARGVLTDNNLFGPEDVNPNPLGGAELIDAKGFSATGTLGGRPYWVAVFWGGELGDSVQLRGWDAEDVTAELRVHQGQEFELAPQCSRCSLRLDNALSILAALMSLSDDFDWYGDKPPGYLPAKDGGRGD